MKPRVYLETTIPSYLASRPSRDLVVAAHQQVTWDWWRGARQRFELFISELVLEEIRAGDAEAAARRSEFVVDLPVLRIDDEVRILARAYQEELGLPGSADVLHIASAVRYEMDYLITWNCAHIANGAVIRRLMQANVRLRRSTPLVLTPDALLEPGTGDAP